MSLHISFEEYVSEEQLKKLLRLVGYEVSVSILEKQGDKVKVSIVCRNAIFLELVHGVLYGSS